MNGVNFELSERTDWGLLQKQFAQRGRVEIDDLLVPGQAEAFRADLSRREDWTLVMNAGEKVYELTRAAQNALDTTQRAQLHHHIVNAARKGFQYRYETIRAPDGGDAAAIDPVARFVAFLSSAAVIERFNYIMNGDGDFADGQATRYAEGHFLTQHDDDVKGKRRLAAYVLSLTPAWQAEWGGLLMFHGPDGHIEEAFVPKMGALRLFAVPQPHSVSYVTPFAPEPRLSVTGWLRSRA